MTESNVSNTLTLEKVAPAITNVNTSDLILPLPLPGEGHIVWYNNTDDYIDVQTFDEKDAWRLIPYEARRIAPKQSVCLTAQGQVIDVFVGNNGATYSCQKGKTYVFNGTNALSKEELTNVEPKETVVSKRLSIGIIDDILGLIPIQPGKGHIVWYNDTNDYVDVQTFDETDAWRLIAYEARRIAPKQAVRLTARGQVIHVYVGNNGATYDCQKGKTYVFNGTNVVSK